MRYDTPTHVAVAGENSLFELLARLSVLSIGIYELCEIIQPNVFFRTI